MYSAVLLTGRESSRFWPLNQRHKSLFYLMGKPIIWWNLKGIEKAGIRKVIVVQSLKRDVEEELKKFKFQKLKIKYLLQKKALGMGNALWQARDFLEKKFFLLNADILDSESILKEMLKVARKSKAVLAGQKTKTPWLFGIIKLRGKKVLEIVEKLKKGREPSKVKAVGVYFLEKSFFEIYQKVKKISMILKIFSRNI